MFEDSLALFIYRRAFWFHLQNEIQKKKNSIKILIDSGESNSVHLKLSVVDNCFRISIIP